MRPFEFLIFMRRYFPVFIGGVLAAICSFAITSVLYFEVFHKDATFENSVIYGFAVMMGATALMCLCHFFLVWGRPKWVWGVVALFFACLCLVLPMIEHRPNKVIYFLGVLVPLIGLSVLNSDRHREMRKIMVIVRNKRERFLGIRKARLCRLNAERCK